MSDLGDEFEEEAELADFHRLLHDVHPEEVVDDDGLENEVALVGCDPGRLAPAPFGRRSSLPGGGLLSAAVSSQ